MILLGSEAYRIECYAVILWSRSAAHVRQQSDGHYLHYFSWTRDPSWSKMSDSFEPGLAKSLNHQWLSSLSMSHTARTESSPHKSHQSFRTPTQASWPSINRSWMACKVEQPKPVHYRLQSLQTHFQVRGLVHLHTHRWLKRLWDEQVLHSHPESPIARKFQSCCAS